MTERTEEKKALRRSLLAARRACDAGFRAEADRRIAERLLASPCFQGAASVFCYVSLPWEVGTDAILREAFLRGKRVFVPRCSPGGVMEACRIGSPDELVPGLYGIPGPAPDAPAADPAEAELVIVPALAFDREGYRIGRGGGYYDRFLPRTVCPRAGLVYERFFLPSLPRDAFDARVDMLFTEEGEYAWV